MVLFNCPEWGIGAQEVIIQSIYSFPLSNATTSCDSLVRVCIQQSNAKMPDHFDLSLVTSPGSTWVHVAEITFYRDCACPPDTILEDQTPPPLPPATLIPSMITSANSTDTYNTVSGEASDLSSTPSSSLRIILGASIPSVAVISAAILLFLVCKCCPICKGRVVLFKRQRGGNNDQVRT